MLVHLHFGCLEDFPPMKMIELWISDRLDFSSAKSRSQSLFTFLHYCSYLKDPNPALFLLSKNTIQTSKLTKQFYCFIVIRNSSFNFTIKISYILCFTTKFNACCKFIIRTYRYIFIF